jgi:hypothetical protein
MGQAGSGSHCRPPRKRYRLDISLLQENLPEEKPAPKPKKSWLLPAAFAAFIVGTITFLMVIDSIYAPDGDSPNSHPDAVGK